MRYAETLSIKARLRISIIALVVTIILTLSFLHLDGVVGETLGDVAERAHLLGDQIKSYVIETSNRTLPPAGVPPLERKRRWYEGVKRDPILPHILQQSLTHSSSVVEVSVLDDADRVLASSTPGREGQYQPYDNSVHDWERRSNWKRLRDLFSNSDYAVRIPLGIAGEAKPVMSIQVLVSSVLMRAEVLPKLRELAVLFTGALLLSVILAMVVSAIFSRSFERISASIESISRGEEAPAPDDSYSLPELQDVESKLNVLGRKFTGTRNDMVSLRSSVDQMLANLEEAVLIFGPDGRLQMAGNPAERLLGRNRKDLIGQPLEHIFPDWTGVGKKLQEAMGLHTNLRSAPAVWERPNLPDVKLLVSLEWLDFGEGRTGMLVTLRDSESRQHVASQLDVAQRLSSISRVMAGVGHEIKNPLNAMMLHLEIAKDKVSGNQSATNDLETVRREMLRLDKVLKTFLDFNRPLEVNFAELDLVQLAKELAGILNAHAKSRDISIVVDARIEQAVINADAALLQQAVLNVVTNGLEAMNKPGQLTIGIERKPEHCVLSVHDWGDGIPAEIQDKIFNLYFTTKPFGTGVGLAVAYRVVQMHGATIVFESEAGRGTCFRLSFPHAVPTQAAA